MKNNEQGFGDWVVIVLGLFLALCAIGFWRADRGIFDKVNFKAAMRLPCGLTYSGISDNQKIILPLEVTGYINECGWTVNERMAGKAQIFDGKGLAVTTPFDLIITDNGTQYPYPFKATLHAISAPETDTGQFVFTSNSGMLKIIPISF